MNTTIIVAIVGVVSTIVGGVIGAATTYAFAVRRETVDVMKERRNEAIEVKRAARLIDAELNRGGCGPHMRWEKALVDPGCCATLDRSVGEEWWHYRSARIGSGMGGDHRGCGSGGQPQKRQGCCCRSWPDNPTNFRFDRGPVGSSTEGYRAWTCCLGFARFRDGSSTRQVALTANDCLWCALGRKSPKFFRGAPPESLKRTYANSPFLALAFWADRHDKMRSPIRLVMSMRSKHLPL
jgi:hypothetical protein